MPIADVPRPRGVDRLPVDHRGYPVPWFAAWLDEDDNEVPPGQGEPEFRVVGSDRLYRALTLARCWICGLPTARDVAFVAGPMCAINRTSAEPPSHVECADYAARVCPFLTHPKATRREANMPAGEDPPGIMLRRNPGVALVWITRRNAWRLRRTGDGGVLCDIGEPTETRWYHAGQPATRAQVDASIEEGLPELEKHVRGTNERLELARLIHRASRHLPKDSAA